MLHFRHAPGSPRCSRTHCKTSARHAGLTWFDVNATSVDKMTSGGRVHCQHPVPVTTELFCSRARPRPGALLTGLLQLTTTTAPTAWWRCCWLHLRCDCERMRTLIKNRSTTVTRNDHSYNSLTGRTAIAEVGPLPPWSLDFLSQQAPTPPYVVSLLRVLPTR